MFVGYPAPRKCSNVVLLSRFCVHSQPRFLSLQIVLMINLVFFETYLKGWNQSCMSSPPEARQIFRLPELYSIQICCKVGRSVNLLVFCELLQNESAMWIKMKKKKNGLRIVSYWVAMHGILLRRAFEWELNLLKYFFWSFSWTLSMMTLRWNLKHSSCKKTWCADT